jgi:prepilin-type processing-associated H-X9-DG protein
MNNLRQLGLGMKMYVDDNRDAFPGIASRTYGFHPEDWIYWRTNSALYPSYEKSPILTSVPGLQKPSLRCPLDIGNGDRLAVHYPDDYGPYLFSYSFTGYGLDQNKKNVGMSSVVDRNGNKYLFKEGGVNNPAQKIMLAEEPGSTNQNDNLISDKVVNDGRWIPGQPLPLTIRHGGKADVTFADGHVQPVTPEFGNDPLNSQPDL